MDKASRCEEIKLTIINKISKETNDGIIAELYSEIVGCVDCKFQWECDKRRMCTTSILKYLKKGSVI